MTCNFVKYYFSIVLGVKHGTPEDWNFAWKMYNSTQVASERNLWLRSLASSNEPYIIQQYLDSVFNRSKVRSQDVRTVIATIAKNPAGSQVIRRKNS